MTHPSYAGFVARWFDDDFLYRWRMQCGTGGYGRPRGVHAVEGRQEHLQHRGVGPLYRVGERAPLRLR